MKTNTKFIRTINIDLNKFDYSGDCNNSQFVNVTEWENGEGYDISIFDGKRESNISLTVGELKAINFAVLALDGNYSDDHKKLESLNEKEWHT